MARQLNEEERKERETLRDLYGYGRPDSDDKDIISLAELSEMDYGFNVFERYPRSIDRMAFVVSDEAAELRALLQAQRAKVRQERRERMKPEQRRTEDLETELLLLQLAQVDREINKHKQGLNRG